MTTQGCRNKSCTCGSVAGAAARVLRNPQQTVCTSLGSIFYRAANREGRSGGIVLPHRQHLRVQRLLHATPRPSGLKADQPHAFLLVLCAVASRQQAPLHTQRTDQPRRRLQQRKLPAPRLLHAGQEVKAGADQAAHAADAAASTAQAAAIAAAVDAATAQAIPQLGSLHNQVLRHIELPLLLELPGGGRGGCPLLPRLLCVLLWAASEAAAFAVAIQIAAAAAGSGGLGVAATAARATAAAIAPAVAVEAVGLNPEAERAQAGRRRDAAPQGLDIRLLQRPQLQEVGCACLVVGAGCKGAGQGGVGWELRVRGQMQAV